MVLQPLLLVSPMTMPFGSNELLHSPAEIVRKLLIQNSVCSEGTDYTYWPAFVNEEPDGPHNCITVIDQIGRIHGRTHVNGEVQEGFGILIRSRGIKSLSGTSIQSGYRAAYTKLKTLCDHLDQQVYHDVVTLDDTNYVVHSANRMSNIDALGRNRINRERYVFTVDYEFTITQLQESGT